MPNLATTLRNEISRVARKEVRGETIGLKKAVAAYRREIAALKRRTQALEQLVRRGSKAATAASVSSAGERRDSVALRFSAKGLRSQRKRLGLSAAECGLLVGASAQSVYNWEQGKARPQTKHLAAFAGLRTLGKRDAAAVIGSRQSGR